MKQVKQINQKTFVFALFASVLMSGCGGSIKVPTAIATQPPPTANPITPTAKPVAASSGDVAQDMTKVLTEAMSKTREAKSYSGTFTLMGKGAVMGLPGEATDNEERVLMNQTSRIDGANSSTEIDGSMTKMLSSSAGVAYLTVDGTTYVKGPATLLGAPEAKWYVVPAQRAGTIRLPMQATDLFKNWTVEREKMNIFKLAVTEEMDGQSCQVYTANQEDLIKSKGLFAATISEIDTAEAHLAVCADGYIHEWSTSLGGKLKNDPTQSGRLSMTVRLSDFGKTFAFEAPKDPEPLQEPILPTPTHAKTSTPGTQTDFPKPDDAKNVFKAGDGVMILETSLSLKEALAFYRKELAAQGLEINKTVESDSAFILVMSGLPDGKSVVVQGVKIDAKKTTITIRTEAT